MSSLSSIAPAANNGGSSLAASETLTQQAGGQTATTPTSSQPADSYVAADPSLVQAAINTHVTPDTVPSGSPSTWTQAQIQAMTQSDIQSLTQTQISESLNGKIRDELLNMHSFTTIFEARRAADAWRDDYNDFRPHSALDLLTPREFADRFKINHASQLSAA